MVCKFIDPVLQHDTNAIISADSMSIVGIQANELQTLPN